MSDKFPSSLVERAKQVIEIYTTDGKALDCFYLADALRALDLNPSLKLIEKLGGTKTKGAKKVTLEEFLPLYEEAKNDKDIGNYYDFVECMKLYDKAEDGRVLLADVQHILISLGEKLTDEEFEAFRDGCMDPEDDDGFIPYVPFLAKLCDHPPETT